MEQGVVIKDSEPVNNESRESNEVGARKGRRSERKCAKAFRNNEERQRDQLGPGC